VEVELLQTKDRSNGGVMCGRPRVRKHTVKRAVRSDESNQSPLFADKQVSGSDQFAPFEQSGVA
jgi:hypothetical protein